MANFGEIISPPALFNRSNVSNRFLARRTTPANPVKTRSFAGMTGRMQSGVAALTSPD